MKKIILLVSVFFISSSVLAWTIGPMNYQGRLLDNAGIPVTGSYNFKVRIYDAASGGVLKFSEEQNSITVDDGVYSFLVSTGINPTGAWDIALWNTPQLYLEIEVGGETLTPRHLMAAAPYAFQANLALTTNNALALGGKSAGNVLQDICKAGKGKWLELVNQCLGIGASFPGPALVDVDTLTASTDFSKLDLTNADISGINFGAVNFTNTLFKNTTINGAGLGSANMTNAIWDAVIVTGAKVLSNNFTGASISQTDMTGWNLANAILTNSSIAHLLACPSSLPASPAQYRCRGESNDRIILGPNMNLSATSLMEDKINTVSDPSNFMFNNNVSGNAGVPIDLSGASFADNALDGISIDTVNLSGADFTAAKIRNVYFNNNNFSGAAFQQSVITSTRFAGTQAAGAANFSGAHLNAVQFWPGAFGTVSSFQFGYAFVLDAVSFSGYEGAGDMTLDFSSGTWKDVTIDAGVSYLYAIGINVYGGLYVGPNVTISDFENLYFYGGNVSGSYMNTAIHDGTFTNVSFYGANFTNTTGMDTNIYNSVNWYGATCPDGYQVMTQGGTCVGHWVL